MRQNRAVLGWPWRASCFACTSYDEMGAFFVSLSWVNLCGDKIVSVRTKLAPNKYAWYRRKKLNSLHCSIPPSPQLLQCLFITMVWLPSYSNMNAWEVLHLPWHYDHTTQSKALWYSPPTTAHSRETHRKLCSAHNTLKWCYKCVEYKQTMWKMWWLCPPLFVGSNLPCLNGDLCISDLPLASIETGLCHYHFTSLCFHNGWWLLPLTLAFLNIKCRKYICSRLPYYYWSSFSFVLVTTVSCPVTNASHPRRHEISGIQVIIYSLHDSCLD